MDGDDIEVPSDAIVAGRHVERPFGRDHRHQQALRERLGTRPGLDDFAGAQDPQHLLASDLSLICSPQRVAPPPDTASPGGSSNGLKTKRHSQEYSRLGIRRQCPKIDTQAQGPAPHADDVATARCLQPVLAQQTLRFLRAPLPRDQPDQCADRPAPEHQHVIPSPRPVEFLENRQ